MPKQYQSKITEIMSDKLIKQENVLFAYSSAGEAGKLVITASLIMSSAFIPSSTVVFLGIAKFDPNDKTINEVAKNQVAFSKKSVVFFAPIIWFPAPPPNDEDNPPPLGF